MEQYYHSVTLIEDRCKGCTHCIRECPTEAIRVRQGKAEITNVRCIDCGNCIRICPNEAKQAVTDSLEVLKGFRYNIALPAPSFAGQFRSKVPLAKAYNGLLLLGFDFVYEVALAAEAVNHIYNQYIEEKRSPYPIISSACPAVVRLIQVRFPGLIDNIARVIAPIDIAALYAKELIHQRTGIPIEEIGAFFITPCPAKVTAIKQPVADWHTPLDGAISMKEIYNLIRQKIDFLTKEEGLIKAIPSGMQWAMAGGEAKEVHTYNKIAVSGINNVISILEKAEDGELNDVVFIEAQACAGGCVGGVLTPRNRFLAVKSIERLLRERSDKDSVIQKEVVLKDYTQHRFDLPGQIQPRSIVKLDKDIMKALQKMERVEQIRERLPGIDCGICGCPTCQALAEDVVQGLADETDCLFVLRDRMREIAGEMKQLTSKMPNVISKKKTDES